MQHELPTIDFVSLAEVWSKAEHRRTEEIAGLLRLIFKGWVAKFRRKSTTVGAVRYAPVAALARNQRVSSVRT